MFHISIALFTKSTLSPHHPQDHEHDGAENDATVGKLDWLMPTIILPSFPNSIFGRSDGCAALALAGGAFALALCLLE